MSENNTYTCAMCKQTYTKEITDEEAMQETQGYFPGTKQKECGVVCDDCWQKIRPDRQVGFNVTLTCKRIAVRYPNNAWEWFGPPVHFKLKGWFEHPLKWYTAYSVLESICESAVKECGFDNCKIVEAPSEEAYALVDLREI